jgi:enoyl-CoA hydratase
MNTNSYTYRTLEVERAGQVATIRLAAYEDFIGDQRVGEAGLDMHWDVGRALDELRWDNEIRVVVLTGAHDDFLTCPPAKFLSDDGGEKYLCDPRGSWLTFNGIVRTHMIMAEMEKPIIAKVNGDALGFGAALTLASDIIIADEAARIAFIHMAMGEVTNRRGEISGPEYAVAPGDGGAALVPLYMTPPKAKEFLMLGQVQTAAELAENGLINRAVATEALDGVVDDYAERLLQRGAYALAWAKRCANRRVVDQLNMTLDAAAAYELVTCLQARDARYVEPRSFA